MTSHGTKLADQSDQSNQSNQSNQANKGDHTDPSNSSDSSDPTGALHRVHAMQFGTHFSPDGIHFRLWAPQARQVNLLLNVSGEKIDLPMTASDAHDGWFSISTTKAKKGDSYQFIIDKDLAVPDPASRYQPNDVHGASEIIDPEEFEWHDGEWLGKPWESTILYELNVGTFSKEGTFKGIENKLDDLVKLGITAIELMPISDFPGRWGWGYDGVLPFGPEAGYGRPEDLKSLVQAAHSKGLMVFLDVVYNHFGPEGNYLHAYAKQFFTEKHNTPWGAAINYDDVGSDVVRNFFIENALYWLEEYHIDGLRLDAVHAIKDDSKQHFLKELAGRVKAGPGAHRHVHLVLENEENNASYLSRDGQHHPRLYTAQWNDDIHHAFHVLTTGETNGYYADYTSDGSGYSPIEHLGRCLTQGFTYQGQSSKGRKEGRGEPSGDLPPTAFVSFIQNHDQIGNRAFGDRIASLTNLDALMAISAVYLLAPSIPMLFMGEEWGSKTAFCYFCDVGAELAPLVTAGRRKEFAKFPEFSKPETRELIPDPCSLGTFEQSKLDWNERQRPENSQVLAHYTALIATRKTVVNPMIAPGVSQIKSQFECVSDGGLRAWWQIGDLGRLTLLTNLSNNEVDISSFAESTVPKSEVIYHSKNADWQNGSLTALPPWSVVWLKSAVLK